MLHLKPNFLFNSNFIHSSQLIESLLFSVIEPQLIFEFFTALPQGFWLRLFQINVIPKLSCQSGCLNIGGSFIMSFRFSIHSRVESFARIENSLPVFAFYLHKCEIHSISLQLFFDQLIIYNSLSIQILEALKLILLQKMIKKKLWIMDNSTIESFQKYRLQRYKASQLKKQINDHPLTKHYVYLIIHFFRKRRISKDDPFKAERLVHTAVCLYKRYYLVNQYSDVPPIQNVLISIYLSMKINEMAHEEITEYAKVWKNKNETFISEDCLHFKDPGYTEKQLMFLRGIGFQIGRSPLVACIESLFHMMKQKINNSDLTNQILDFILEAIRRVYLDDKAIFLYEGPKLGLAIILHTIRIKKSDQKLANEIQQLIGTQITSVLQRNKIQVDDIVNYISKLEKIEHKELSTQAKQLRDKIMKLKKNSFEVPEKKSPKITPLNFQFEDH